MDNYSYIEEEEEEINNNNNNYNNNIIVNSDSGENIASSSSIPLTDDVINHSIPVDLNDQSLLSGGDHNDDDHHHSNEGEKSKKKHKKHGHSHGHGHDHSHGHGHGHGHAHGDEEEDSHNRGFFNFRDKKKKARMSLLIALTLTTIFMIGEIVGGYLANSLAIMTDAAHLLTDIGAMCLSLFAMWVSTRPPTTSMSFGFHRAEILGALASVLMIWALTGVLLYEAVQRIIHPPEIVDGKVMFIIASGGLLINIIDAIVLSWGSGGHGHSHGLGGGHSHGEKKKKKAARFSDDDLEELNAESKKHKEIENINVHSAYIHVLGDCLQSVGVMIASVIIWVKPSWKIADPITTFIFSILVLVTTIRLLKQSLSVLMEAVPGEINSSDVQDDLSELPGVTEVHDLHIWSITIGKTALSAHLSIGEGVDADHILESAIQLLADNHNITHTTIQIEKPKPDSKCRDNSCPPPPLKLTPSARNRSSPRIPEQ